MTEVVVAPLAMTVTSSSDVIQMSIRVKCNSSKGTVKLKSPAFISHGMKGIDVACSSSFWL